jgi:hypothetical protein
MIKDDGNVIHFLNPKGTYKKLSCEVFYGIENQRCLHLLMVH